MNGPIVVAMSGDVVTLGKVGSLVVQPTSSLRTDAERAAAKSLQFTRLGPISWHVSAEVVMVLTSGPAVGSVCLGVSQVDKV